MLPSPGARGGCGECGAARTQNGVARRMGGRALAAAVGEGRRGRAAEGGGLPRGTPAECASGSRASAALFPFNFQSPLLLLASPNQNKTEDLPRCGFGLRNCPSAALGSSALGGRSCGWGGEWGAVAWSRFARSQPAGGRHLRGAHGSDPAPLGCQAPDGLVRAGQKHTFVSLRSSRETVK